MSKRKLFDMFGEGPSTREDEIIFISDSEEEPLFTDIQEIPTSGVSDVVPEEEPMREDEDPEEDPEWDEEAAAHDAAVLRDVEDQSEEGFPDEDDVPIEEVPEPDYDSAWEEPALELEEIEEGDIAPEEIVAEEEPEEDVEADFLVQVIQSAAAEVQAVQDMAQEYRDIRDAEIAQLRDQIAAEQRRNARLTTSLEVVRTVCDGTQERLDRLEAECSESFRGLVSRVERYPQVIGQPSYTIARETVRQMVIDTARRTLGRY